MTDSFEDLLKEEFIPDLDDLKLIAEHSWADWKKMIFVSSEITPTQEVFIKAAFFAGFANGGFAGSKMVIDTITRMVENNKRKDPT